jgi:hypothetical protein
MGGIVKGKDITAHISSPNILTPQTIEYLEKEYGMKLRCTKCGKHLVPGDTVDHFWPYFDDYNLCRLCKQNYVKQGRKITCQKNL